MDLEPTLFPSPMYETANEAVLHCLSHLQKSGHADSIADLNGLPPVNEAVVGRVVFRRLTALRPHTTATSKHYIDIALNALGRALELPEARAVA